MGIFRTIAIPITSKVDILSGGGIATVIQLCALHMIISRFYPAMKSKVFLGFSKKLIKI